MTDHASKVDELVSRIGPSPAPASPASSDEWQRLAEWWQRMGSSQDVVDAWLPPQSDVLEDGVVAAERAIDAGSNLLIAHLPDDESTRARALIGVLCHRDAAAVTYQSYGMTDAQWALQCAHTRDHICAWVAMRGEPMALLQIAGDDGVTTMVGCLLAAAARRTPVILDGIRALAAAVVADRLAPQASTWWRAASTSPDPAHTIARERIDLERGLPLNISTSDAHGSRAILALLREVTDNERDSA